MDNRNKLLDNLIYEKLAFIEAYGFEPLNLSLIEDVILSSDDLEMEEIDTNTDIELDYLGFETMRGAADIVSSKAQSLVYFLEKIVAYMKDVTKKWVGYQKMRATAFRGMVETLSETSDEDWDKLLDRSFSPKIPSGALKLFLKNCDYENYREIVKEIPKAENAQSVVASIFKTLSKTFENEKDVMTISDSDGKDVVITWKKLSLEKIKVGEYIDDDKEELIHWCKEVAKRAESWRSNMVYSNALSRANEYEKQIRKLKREGGYTQEKLNTLKTQAKLERTMMWFYGSMLDRVEVTIMNLMRSKK